MVEIEFDKLKMKSFTKWQLDMRFFVFFFFYFEQDSEIKIFFSLNGYKWNVYLFKKKKKKLYSRRELNGSGYVVSSALKMEF